MINKNNDKKFINCEDFKKFYTTDILFKSCIQILNINDINNHILICDDCNNFKLQKDKQELEYINFNCNLNFKGDI